MEFDKLNCFFLSFVFRWNLRKRREAIKQYFLLIFFFFQINLISEDDNLPVVCVEFLLVLPFPILRPSFALPAI